MNVENFDNEIINFKLITLLIENSKFISTKNIAEQLNLTEAAILKQINSLREEGLKIDSTPNREYKLQLLSEIDTISPTLIRYLLKNNHHFHTCLTFDEIDSTQTVIKNMVLEKASEGVVVTAEYQRLGRGRRGRSWANSKGKNLMFSVLLTPNLKAENIPLLNLAVALAIRTVLFSIYSIKADLKWPNDILVENKKICGILSEIIVKPGNKQSVVTGIGLNVNMREENFSDEIKTTATSMLIESERVVSRPYLLVEILNQISAIIETFNMPDGVDKLLVAYKKACATLDKEVVVTQENESYTGIAADITDKGALVVKINGKESIFYAADIKHLRNK